MFLSIRLIELLVWREISRLGCNAGWQPGVGLWDIVLTLKLAAMCIMIR